MNFRDILLIFMTVSGVVIGIALPDYAGLFSPYVLYGMLTILFLSFLRIDFTALLRPAKKDLVEAVGWTFIKLLALPVALWALASLLVPDYALPVLLLSGVSTGVTAPFFSNQVGGNTTRVLQMVVLSSLLVPITLPALVKLLMGQTISIPFFDMARMLLVVILGPLTASIFVRKFIPKLVSFLERVNYPVSVTLFCLINMGVFAPNSAFLLGNLDQLFWVVLLDTVLAVLFLASGALGGRTLAPRLDGLNGALGMTCINNVLVIVFTSQFFGPESSLLAALYNVPYVFALLPLRWMANRGVYDVVGSPAS